MNSFNDLVMMARQGGNPLPMMQQMAAQNPRMGAAMQLINGKNARQLQQTAMNIAKERGIDLNAYAAQMGFGPR